MGTIAYSSPFVPPEWIEAHGFVARRVGVLTPEPKHTDTAMGRCSYATLIGNPGLENEAAGIILATTCDQMRRAAELIAKHRPTFLLNVPATWQSAVARRMYREELERLGEWLLSLGGSRPAGLREIMLAHDQTRRELRSWQAILPAADYSRCLATYFQTGRLPDFPSARARAGWPVAIIGGPLRGDDLTLLELVEQRGGRVVLDGTEGGERSLVGPFDHREMNLDALGELACAYFSIPDPFRRPNTQLYDWLAHHIATRAPRGIIVIRRVWCDLWHAEVNRIAKAFGLPVVDLDLDGSPGELERCRTRIESLLEVIA